MDRRDLTVGMATYNDFDGVYFTAMSLRAHHGIEHIVVVDNNPVGPIADALAGFCRSIKATYVPLASPQGTAPPRNAVFAHSKTSHTACVDSHVLLKPGAVDALVAHYAADPGSSDLIQGPMVYDWLTQEETHFSDVWRGEMWGTWGYDERARQDAAFDIPAMGLGLFATRTDAWLGFNPAFRGFGGEEWYIHLKYRNAGRRTLCLPALRWVHRFARPTANNGVTVGIAPYRVDKWDKVRNYIIGHRELGLPLDRVREHFCGPQVRFPASYFDMLEADVDARHPEEQRAAPAPRPVAAPPSVTVETHPAAAVLPAPAAPGPVVTTRKCCGAATQLAQEPVNLSLDAWYKLARETPHDINEHVAMLREYASRCKHVTEFGKRHGVSTVGLLHAQPETLVSINPAPYPEVPILEKLRGKTDFRFTAGDSPEADIAPTDMLFLDTVHTKARLAAELEKYAPLVGSYIALHDTLLYGEKGSDGGPGLLHAVRDFIREHPEWTVVYSATNNNGLMVLSRRDEDRQKPPGFWAKANNFRKHLTAHLAAGAPTTPPDEQSKRLELCLLCPIRAGGDGDEFKPNDPGVCTACGCPILKKIAWAEQNCPLGKWAAVKRPEAASTE
ncbi:CmcI family methyltransferase [Fimbriiglobus ruber]|uniref:Glycosyltransferase 2-like domain-containing protein n=1 Tax=Fimbriiglobus ruber TaxID=1908690 RepID=A0A225D9I4_9BACT|nr:CmcI family methyltransferase [Fimbriiglobus ruber]OWK38122.1 hypothetical protein FRUB_07242 [Fimbriiglobus ruber]